MSHSESPCELNTPDDVSADVNAEAANTTADSSNSGLSRRQLLTTSAALSAAGLLATRVEVTAEAQDKAGDGKAPAVKPDAVKTKMPLVALGKTGFKTSRLAMGGSWSVDTEVVATGVEQGINYLDTAEGYNRGHSEEAFGEFLKAQGATGKTRARQKFWLVTKTHDHYNLEKRLAGSLQRLQQDYVDCYYMHQIQDTKLPANPDIKAVAARLKKEGKIRFFGFSCHDGNVPECLNAAADSDFIDVVMFRYDYHYYKSDDLNRAIDRCVKAGVGLVAMKTQVGGMTLPEKFNPFKQRGLNQHQAAIKAVAVDERIAAICSEMTNEDQMKQNAGAVASKLTVAEAEAIQEHARLVSHLWCRGCDHVCRAASGAGQQIAVADSLRFLMYHDHYGKREHARSLYAELPERARDLNVIAAADWKEAEAACPHNVPIAKLMERVKERLA